jgi:hypothetical protein
VAINTLIYSPQGIGLAEAFVNPMTRDYVSRIDIGDAAGSMAHLREAFPHGDEVHPRSILGVRT